MFAGRAAAMSVALVLLAGTGCGDATGPAPALEISVTGWIERGAVLGVTASRMGEVIPAGAVTWSAEPESAVRFLGNDQVRLLSDGPVALSAEAAGRTGNLALDVALPPFVLFDDRVDGNRDIFRVRLDGSDRERITVDAADDADPHAGGGTIAFSSLRDGNPEIYRVPVTGGAPVRVTTTPGSAESQPAMSRDGSRLAFSRSEAGTEQVLWLALAGGPAVRVSEGLALAGGIEASPSWSPGAVRLALMSTVNGQADIWSVERDRSDAEPLADTDEVEVEPAWHPEQNRIVYAAVVPGEGADLFLLDGTDGSLTRLTDRVGSDGQPTWLPDGRIVFTAWEGAVPALRWLDPDDPLVTWPIPLGGGTGPQNPSGVH